jgi:hypothetical protein
MAGALTQPTRRFDSERERRRRDRHARLATDRALAEVAFSQRPRHRQEHGADPQRAVSPAVPRRHVPLARSSYVPSGAALNIARSSRRL